MADEMFEDQEDVGSLDDGGDSSGGKRFGFLSGVVIQVLKWLAIVVGAIVFVVTVTVVTVRMLGPGQSADARSVVESDAFEVGIPQYSYFDNIPPLRGATADDERFTYVVQISIAYPLDDEGINNELINKTIPITDRLLTYFSQQRRDRLLSQREQVKQEILQEINQIMVEDVSDVFFVQYEVI